MEVPVSPSVTLEPQTGTALRLPAGSVLRVIAVTGEQVADLALFDASDTRNAFSPGRTMDYNERTVLRVGDSLFSNCSTELARVVEDTVGVHDMLLSPCSEAMFARRGEIRHPSCHGNLAASLARFGIDERAITATLNVFMDVRVSGDGNISIHPPPSREGDTFAVEALRDLIVGITACSSELTNNGRCKPVAFEIVQK